MWSITENRVLSLSVYANSVVTRSGTTPVWGTFPIEVHRTCAVNRQITDYNTVRHYYGKSPMWINYFSCSYCCSLFIVILDTYCPWWCHGISNNNGLNIGVLAKYGQHDSDRIFKQISLDENYISVHISLAFIPKGPIHCHGDWQPIINGGESATSHYLILMGTWRNNNVIITSKRRRFDAIMTLSLHHVPAGI